MNQHPNATVAGGTTGVGLLVIWILGNLGVQLSAEAGADYHLQKPFEIEDLEMIVSKGVASHRAGKIIKTP